MRIQQEIPYHKQLTDYTCGPAVVRSLIQGLRGKEMGEAYLSMVMGTNDRDGTHPSYLLKKAGDYGLKVMSGEGADVNTLRKLIEDGFVPAVCYKLHDGDFHYSLVKEIEGDKVHMIDPYNGPDVVWDSKDFQKNWYSEWNRGWYAGFK